MKKIVKMAIAYGVIQEKHEGLYVVAITSLFFSALTWGTLIIYGSIFHVVYGSLIFLLFHIPLRIYAGGFHQSTRTKCYIQSCLIYILIMWGNGTIVSNVIVTNWALFMLVSCIAVFIFAPVTTPNKRLTISEIKHHAIIARIISIVEIIAASCLVVMGLQDLLYFVTVSNMLVTILIVLGIMQEKSGFSLFRK